jgi:hypothetical protein
MATKTNAELLAMSGKRNPYPGKLGVVEEGALADLLLVDGDPLKNLKLIADPARKPILDSDGAFGWRSAAVNPISPSGKCLSRLPLLRITRP